jgi:hypothetical protein
VFGRAVPSNAFPDFREPTVSGWRRNRDYIAVAILLVFSLIVVTTVIYIGYRPTIVQWILP